MIDKIKEILHRWSQEGMRFPFVHDPTSGKPSITLMFFYITFVVMMTVISFSSALMLAKGDYYLASAAPIIVWTLSYVFYRLRRLDKFKLDLDDKSISLESGEEEDKNESN